MKEEFKPVEVIKSFLGIKKGTILKFDNFNSKYISRSGEEEIGDDIYYYSGSAVEIDPMIVNRNLDKYFRLFELPEAKPNEPLAAPEQAVSEPVVEQKPEEADVDPTAKIKDKDMGGTLVFECGLCHFVTEVASVKYGLFLPATKDTSLKLKCKNCGLEAKVYYNVGDETTKEGQ